MRERDVVLRFIRDALSETRKGQVNAEKCTRGDERKEIAIIATANAIVQPDAVVIQCFDTIIAYSAVITSRWSPDVAGFAVFDRNVHSSSL